MERKLGRPTDQRMAIIKNQASELLWYGHITTTLDRAKEVRRFAEKILTMAINSWEDDVKVVKNIKNASGKREEVEFTNDGADKLAARRRMMSRLMDLQEVKKEKESKADFRARTKDINHPLIEKIFNEYAPKYSEKNASQTQGGGYTRIIRTGTRRGDNAKTVVLELV